MRSRAVSSQSSMAEKVYGPAIRSDCPDADLGPQSPRFILRKVRRQGTTGTRRESDSVRREPAGDDPIEGHMEGRAYMRTHSTAAAACWSNTTWRWFEPYRRTLTFSISPA